MAAKFAIGQPVPRKEDPRLLRGGGRYTDDIDLPGQYHGFVLRSPLAHGIVRTLNTAPALATPGVVAVFTGGDLAEAGVAPFPFTLPLTSHDGSPPAVPQRWALARGRVNHVGEALALVVGESVHAARDGAEAIGLEIEPLPVVTDPEAALAANAVQVHDEVPNLCLDWRSGDFAAVEQAFAGAAHVVRRRLAVNRTAVATTEPRGALAAYAAADGRFVLHVGCQGVFAMRQDLAQSLPEVAPERFRVLSHDVGGSFGMKSALYPEYLAILHAARVLGRPLKWSDDRAGSFLSDQQAREAVFRAELALDAESTFLALRIEGLANLGAYLTTYGPLMTTISIERNAPSLYQTPLMAIRTRCVFTNTVPIGPYRGAGRPEGNYIMERLVDAAARELGRDPAELRRQNLIPPQAIPYRAPSGLEYDSGDFPAVLESALEKADWPGFAARQAESRSRNRLRGRGLACYLEATAAPSREMGGIRFGPGGDVTIVTGTLDYGQGHATAFAQVLAQRLGLPFGKIDLLQKDSDELLHGGGTGGSRSLVSSGSAIVKAAGQVIAKGGLLAARHFEAAQADIEFQAGHFGVVGTDRRITLPDLAAGHPGELDVALVEDTPPSTFPNGCHVCELEIDPESGEVAVLSYVVVDDFGTIVNPLLVEGQVQGGIAQGLGQVLMEDVVYDPDGQLLTGSFMDFALPRADHMPPIEFHSHPVPATSNPLGVKGCGEAGTTGALPAVMLALLDALAPLGVQDIDMPATPERVWRAIREASLRAPN